MKKLLNMENKTKYSLIVVILLGLDIITKILLEGSYKDYGIIAINSVHNTGVSFGMLKSVSPIAFIILSLAVIGLLVYYRKEFKGFEIYLTLIITGIVGNLIDRVFLGYVRDFIDLKWWPIFNVADSLMFIGVFGIIITIIVQEVKKAKKKKKRLNKK